MTGRVTPAPDTLKKCCIVGAGSFDTKELELCRDSYIIAADGGYAHLLAAGVTPDMAVGDFDSLGSVPNHPNIVKHPPRKDDTDTVLAVKIALDMGFNDITVLGGLGGRLDHSMANIQTLVYLSEKGAIGRLIGEGCCITVIRDGQSVCFDSAAFGTVSVFSLSDVSTGVSESGLAYTLEDATLTNSYPIGVSNEFIGCESRISVGSGILAVMTVKDVKSK